MTMPRLIEAEIATALAPLVDKRAYPVVMPQGVEYPAITFHRLRSGFRSADTGSDEIRARAAQGLASTFQIVVWARSYLDGIRIFRAAKTALETIGLVIDNASDGYDSAADVYTVIQEYTFWGDLNADREGQAVSPPIVAPLVDGILNGVRDHFGDRLPVIEWYSPFRRHDTTPAVYLELSKMSLGAYKGDDTIPIACELQLLAALPRHAGDLAVRDFAAELAVLVESNKWELGAAVSFPDDITIEPMVYTPTGEGLLVWSVSWSQTIHVNLEQEQPCHLPPKDVLVGYNPETAPDDYDHVVKDGERV